MDPAVNLVRYEPDPTVSRPRRDRLELGPRVDRARGIDWGAKNDARGIVIRRALEIGHADFEAVLDVAAHHHRLGPRQVHDLRIRNPGRGRNKEPVAGT